MQLKIVPGRVLWKVIYSYSIDPLLPSSVDGLRTWQLTMDPAPVNCQKLLKRPEGYFRCFDASKTLARAWKETFTAKSFIKRKASYSTTSRRGVLIVDNGSKYKRKQENNNISTVGIRRYDAYLWFKPLLGWVLIASSEPKISFQALFQVHCLVHFHLIWSCIKDMPDIGQTHFESGDSNW